MVPRRAYLTKGKIIKKVFSGVFVISALQIIRMRGQSVHHNAFRVQLPNPVDVTRTFPHFFFISVCVLHPAASLNTFYIPNFKTHDP